MAVAALGGMAIGAMGNILEQQQAEEANRNAEAALKGAQSNIQGIGIPSIEEQKIQLHQLTLQGIITPDQEQDILQDPTKLQQITTDPRLQAAQISALQQMGQVAQTGMLAPQQAALIQTQNAVNQQDAARRASILQNMAQRGMLGSGATLAAQLQGEQSAAQQAQQGGLSAAAQAQQGALQALAQQGSMAGQIRGQDYSQQAAAAQAQDAINQFNAAQRIAAQQRNVAAQNQAQYYNLNQKQQIANANVGIQNQQEMYNKALYQQQFQDQMARELGAANLAVPLANQAQTNYKNQYVNTSNLFSGLSGGMGAAAGSGGNAPQGVQTGGGGGGGGAGMASAASMAG